MSPITEKKPNIAVRRPAETAAAGTAATIVAFAALFGIDVSAEAVGAIIVAVGFVPSIVTAIVDRVRSL